MKNIKPSRGIDGLTDFSTAKGASAHIPSGKPMSSTKKMAEKAPAPMESNSIGSALPSLEKGRMNLASDEECKMKSLSHPGEGEAMKTHRE